MPFPAAPLIYAGAELLGSGLNAWSTGKMNKKTRQWNEKMYGIQRGDALADWNRMNEYNSPAAQMERFKAAGLNPNLIYGQQNEGAVVRSTAMESWKPTPPQVDFRGVGTGLGMYIDSRVKEAQTNNLEAAVKVAEQEAILKAAQTQATLEGTKKTAQDIATGAFSLEQAKKLAPVNLEMAQANLEKLIAETMRVGAETEKIGVEQAISISRNEREELMNKMMLRKGEMDLATAAETILQMRVQGRQTAAQSRETMEKIRSIRMDNAIKQFDVELARGGIRPGTNAFLRILAAIIESKPQQHIKDLIEREIKSKQAEENQGRRK